MLAAVREVASCTGSGWRDRRQAEQFALDGPLDIAVQQGMELRPEGVVLLCVFERERAGDDLAPRVELAMPQLQLRFMLLRLGVLAPVALEGGIGVYLGGGDKLLVGASPPPSGNFSLIRVA